MGINNIISRAKILGGTVNIDSALQKGCRLSVVVPLVMEEQTA
jgi:signal transduction histidine kinase